MPDAPADNQSERDAGPTRASAVPAVVTSHPPEQVVRLLDASARRGRLAGFRPLPGGTPSLARFRADAFGSPFDGELVGRAERAGAQTRVMFRASVLPRMPIIFAVVLAATVWPGVVLTESMIASFFPGSSAWQWTWWWYIPLTLPFAPWAFWVAWSRSQSAVRSSALEVVTRIAAETHGTIDPPPRAGPGSGPANPA
ncbi:MAG: hypothetical protein AB7K52_00405 [Phycisphaerales bacterium]